MNEKCKNVLLIAPRHTDAMEYGVGNSLSMGALLVGSILKEKGCSVSLLDASLDKNFENNLNKALLDKEYLFIGFSVMTTQFSDAIIIAREVRAKALKTPIVFGGFHATIAPDEVLSSDCVDYIFIGQSHSNIATFVDSLLNKCPISSVDGIGYKLGGELVYTKKYFPAWQDGFVKIDYSIIESNSLEKSIQTGDPLGTGRRFLSVLTGVGCKFKCAFCWNSIYKNYILKMAPDDIVHYCLLLQKKYDVNLFWLYDEHFFSSAEYVSKFIAEISKNNLKASFIVSARSSDINMLMRHNLLGECKKSGIDYLSIGAESGSQRVLNHINKGITCDQTLKIARETELAGIACFFSFMLCMPTETSKDTIATLQLIQKITNISKRHQIIGPQVFRPYPGSKMSDLASKISNTTNIYSFRKIDINSVRWIEKEELKKIEKQYITYNVQSQQAYFEGLLSILVWSKKGIALQSAVGQWLTHRLLAAFLWALRCSAALRIKYNFFIIYPEYSVAKFLCDKYFRQ